MPLAQIPPSDSKASLLPKIHTKSQSKVRALSKSVSLGSPCSNTFTEWELPSLQFRPLSFSTFSQINNSRPRTSSGNVTSESSEIFSPTPERPISSQSNRDRFSKILSIDDSSFKVSYAFNGASIGGQSSPLLRVSKGVTTNEPLFRTTFPPIRERDSVGEASIPEHLSNDDHNEHSSFRSDRFKSTVELLLDNHIEALGSDNDEKDGELVGDEIQMPASAVDIDSRNLGQSPEEPLHTKWKGNVRSAKVISAEEDDSRSTELDIPSMKRVSRSADIVPKRVSSVGSTMKLQEFLKSARPSSSWLTVDTSDHLTTELATALGLNITSCPPHGSSSQVRNEPVEGNAQDQTSREPASPSQSQAQHEARIRSIAKMFTDHWPDQSRQNMMVNANAHQSGARGSRYDHVFDINTTGDLDKALAFDNGFSMRQAVSMDSSRVSIPAPSLLLRKSMGDHPSSANRYLPLAPLARLPAISSIDISTELDRSLAWNCSQSKVGEGESTVHPKDESSPEGMQGNESYTCETESLSADTAIPRTRRSSARFDLIRTRSFFSDNLTQILEHSNNSIRQKWQNVKTQMSSTSGAKQMRREQSHPGIIQLCNPSGPPIVQDSVGTIGMSEFRYRRRRLLDRLKEWWRRHTSQMTLALKRRKSRRSSYEVELYAGV